MARRLHRVFVGRRQQQLAGVGLEGELLVDVDHQQPTAEVRAPGRRQRERRAVRR
jgi:hypothetical protein